MQSNLSKIIKDEIKWLRFIENNKIYDDDEILNECYDNIPCNNAKKASGLNRLFGWK